MTLGSAGCIMSHLSLSLLTSGSPGTASKGAAKAPSQRQHSGNNSVPLFRIPFIC